MLCLFTYCYAFERPRPIYAKRSPCQWWTCNNWEPSCFVGCWWRSSFWREVCNQWSIRRWRWVQAARDIPQYICPSGRLSVLLVATFVSRRIVFSQSLDQRITHRLWKPLWSSRVVPEHPLRCDQNNKERQDTSRKLARAGLSDKVSSTIILARSCSVSQEASQVHIVRWGIVSFQ